MSGTLDLCLRLAAATLAGAVIGVNRDIHRKLIGVRTLGLVSLGSALVTLSGSGFSGIMDANTSRAILGVGFLGAGVIVRGQSGTHVRGLTTAATVWVASAVGIACGLGVYPPVAIGLALMLLLIAVGGPVDRAVHAWQPKKEDDDEEVEGR